MLKILPYHSKHRFGFEWIKTVDFYYLWYVVRFAFFGWFFVSDLFLEDYVGGGELTSEAIIQSSLLPVQKIHSNRVTPKLMESHKDKFWIFGNLED